MTVEKKIPSKKKLVVGGNIIIAADNKIVQKQLVKLFKEKGFEVSKSQIATLKKNTCKKKPAIVVVFAKDYSNLDLNVYCTSNSQQTVKPIIIAICAENMPRQKAVAIDAGADEVFVFPLDEKEIVHRMRKIVLLQREKDISVENSVLLENALETIKQHTVKFENELEEAQYIQKALYPKKKLLLNGFGINFALNPAQKLCGDFIYIKQIDNNNVAIALIDVSGHGTAAAMVAGMIHTWLYSQINKYVSLEQLTESLNQYMVAYTPQPIYATGFIGLLNTKTGILEYVLAGHHEPVYWSDNKIKYLKEADSSCIGLFSDFKAVVHSCKIEQGDGLLIYSDGVLDSFSSKKNPLEELGKLYKIHNCRACFRNTKCTMIKDVLNLGHTTTDDMAVVCIARFKDKSVIGNLTVTVKSANEVDMEIITHEKSIGDFQIFTRGFLSAYVNKELLSDIIFVASELLTNAIEWGNKFDKDKKVYCNIKLAKHKIFVSMEDEGDGFDFKEITSLKSNSDFEEEQVSRQREGGLGLFLTMNIADRLLFNSKGNKVTAEFLRNRITFNENP